MKTLIVIVAGVLAQAVYAVPHALYSDAGQYLRVEDLSPAEMARIPLADDGLPRALPIQSPPAHDAITQALQIQRDGTWLVVDLPAEQAVANAAAAAEAADMQGERDAVVAAFEQFEQILDAGTLTEAQQVAAIKLLVRGVRRLAKDAGYAQ